MVYRKENFTIGIVTRGELVIRTLLFGSLNSTDAKFGCSVKTGKFTTKSQLESHVFEFSIKEAKL